MTNDVSPDSSNGYEGIADTFISVRSSGIGVATVREWSRTLPRGTSVLELGCGHGAPISQTLVEEGFAPFGVDASRTMIAAFRERFPGARAECATVEASAFFHRTFDAAIACGLLFLLPATVQRIVIAKVARALNPGGRFLFTSPQQAATWADALTGRESISLGLPEYERILRAEGLVLLGTGLDEGDNHYYFAAKH